MKTKHYLTLRDAEIILDHAYHYSMTHRFAVSISIVDDSGSLLIMKRMDGASAMTANLSQEKAKCAALSRRPTKIFEDIINNGQMGFLSMQSFSGMLEGGLPIIYEGELVGAIGVSGVKSHQDAEIAQHAINAFLLSLAVEC